MVGFFRGDWSGGDGIFCAAGIAGGVSMSEFLFVSVLLLKI